MKFGIKGVWQHWPSSVMGTIFVGSGVGSVFTGHATWPEAIGIITLGLALLGFKGFDPPAPPAGGAAC